MRMDGLMEGESPIMVDAGGPPLLLGGCYETPPQPSVCSFTESKEFSQNCNTQREKKTKRENAAAPPLSE
jgi:hypothetical protein